MESDRAGWWWVPLIVLLAVGPVHPARAAVGPVLLVIGYESDNMVRFDLTTGLVDFVDPEASRFSLRFYRLDMLHGDAAVR